MDICCVFRPLLLLGSLLSLAACGSGGADINRLAADLAEQKARLDAHLGEDRSTNAASSADRTATDWHHDLQDLVVRYNRLAAALDQTPLRLSKAAPAGPATATETASDEAPAAYTAASIALESGEPFTPPATVPSPETARKLPNLKGMASLHLASYSDAANLVPGWQVLQRAYPAELGSLEPRVRYITLADGKPYLRLMAGALDSVAAAAPICERLRAAGQYCEIRAYEGSTAMETYIIAP